MDCRVAGLSQRKRPAQVVCLGVCTPPRHHERRPRGLRAGASSGCRGCGVGGPGAVSHAFLCRGTRHRGPRMGDGGGGSAEPEEDARGPVTCATLQTGSSPCRAVRAWGAAPRSVSGSPPRALSPFHLHDTLANRPTACPPPPRILHQETGGAPAEPGWPAGTRSPSETARSRRRPCPAVPRRPGDPATSLPEVSPPAPPGRGRRRASRETRGFALGALGRADETVTTPGPGHARAGRTQDRACVSVSARFWRRFWRRFPICCSSAGGRKRPGRRPQHLSRVRGSRPAVAPRTGRGRSPFACALRPTPAPRAPRPPPTAHAAHGCLS